MLAWEWCWLLLCQWTPKPLNPWRLFWLKRFGTRIEGTPFVHQRARIQIPWNVTLRDRSCLGDRANLYSLDAIELGEHAVIAQETYVCAGTHDFSASDLPLITAPVVIHARCFVGARAFILPGVTVGEGAIVGACSVVTKDVASHAVVAGNPAKVIGQRTYGD